MGLEEGQSKTGVTSEESSNPTKKTGRGDGSEGAQKKVGHLAEESGPNPGPEGPDDGFGPTQPKVGVTSEESKPSREYPSGRLDKVTDITGEN